MKILGDLTRALPFLILILLFIVIVQIVISALTGIPNWMDIPHIPAPKPTSTPAG